MYSTKLWPLTHPKPDLYQDNMTTHSTSSSSSVTIVNSTKNRTLRERIRKASYKRHSNNYYLFGYKCRIMLSHMIH